MQSGSYSMGLYLHKQHTVEIKSDTYQLSFEYFKIHSSINKIGHACVLFALMHINMYVI